MGRMGRLRPIPLHDKNSRSFSFSTPDPLIELLHKIDLGLGSAWNLPAAVTHPSTRGEYVVSTLIQESITSSQLEGAVTTRAVAKEMLRTGRQPHDKSERMILNNYRTMQRIMDLRTEPLNPELVFELHRRVTEGTLDDPQAAGRVRRSDERIRIMDMEGTIFHDPPPAAELSVRLAAMCDFANGRTPEYFIHPVIRAILLHFWLAYDHPFVDGNGRTARALFYWLMLHQGLQLFEFISISQILLQAPAQYAMAFLHTEADDNDLTYFLLHQAEVIQRAVKALAITLHRKRPRFSPPRNASAESKGSTTASRPCSRMPSASRLPAIRSKDIAGATTSFTRQPAPTSSASWSAACSPCARAGVFSSSTPSPTSNRSWPVFRKIRRSQAPAGTKPPTPVRATPRAGVSVPLSPQEPPHDPFVFQRTLVVGLHLDNDVSSTFERRFGTLPFAFTIAFWIGLPFSGWRGFNKSVAAFCPTVSPCRSAAPAKWSGCGSK